jgi:hypothetical protein
MTDPKATFLAKAAIVKTELQALATATASAHTKTKSLSESVIAEWQAKGVLTETDAAAIRQNMPTPSVQPMNTQAMVDMIAAMEDIVESLGSSSGFSLSEVSAPPASVTAPGNPGQFYIQGTSLFWLCVRTNFWVKLAML